MSYIFPDLVAPTSFSKIDARTPAETKTGCEIGTSAVTKTSSNSKLLRLSARGRYKIVKIGIKAPCVLPLPWI